MKTNGTKALCMIRPSATLIFVLSIMAGLTLDVGGQTTNTFPDNGNVGIGTTSPGAKLQVDGSDGGSQLAVRIQSSSNQLRIYPYLDATYGTYITSRNISDVYKPLSFEASSFHFGVGNVGIGTTSPSSLLHILGNTSSSILQVRNQSTSAGNSRGLFVAAGTNSSDYVMALRDAADNDLVRVTGAGDFGIGTTSPGARLEVQKASGEGLRVSSGDAANFTYSSIGRTGVDAFFGVAGASNHFWSGTAQGDAVLKMNTSAKFHIGSNQSTPEMTFSGGSVGIGKTNPTVALDVVGNINLTGTIHAKYQDVAEWVESSEQLTAGTVVVLDSTRSNQVISSSQSYDTRVAGVISAQPGIALGEKGDNKVLVATTGRVKIKVDASKSPIHIGDLLVTSDIPGAAMRSEAVNLGGVQIHRPGTLIGKALEPLAKGSGEILVLLSLQ